MATAPPQGFMNPSGVPNTRGGCGMISPACCGSIPVVRSHSEVDAYFPQANRNITGITYTSAGSPLGGCSVMLFTTANNVLVQTTTSDANGNYSFAVDPTLQYYCVFYKATAPDVAGTTVNTLVGV